ncbi:MAG: apolipoprotein N-acyltransferase [Vulcanimicrobiaceae bacterium]
MRTQQACCAIVAALLLALAFPKANIAWLAPLGTAALFLAWESASWKRAFALGWFAGVIFFTISFWWWSTTIEQDVGVFAYIAVVAGAAIEALAWGVAGSLAALARDRVHPALAPLAGAAAFTVTEWLRSIGPLGVPFAQLGYTQVETPLRVLAAYIGAPGVTLAVCAIGAYLANAIAHRTWRRFATALAVITLACGIGWVAWPARALPAPAIPVAAIQGNIAQTLKWQPQALPEAIARYTAMTRSAIALHPRLIVWPETVIPARNGLNTDVPLSNAFAQLARQAGATLVVGSLDVHAGQYYNALFIYSDGGLQAIYDKRQLVPFAETFPGKSFLFWLPYIGELNGGFAAGTVAGVYPTLTGLRIAPLICWESAFGDLAHTQLDRGAQVLVISTDDAWFGRSSGPYQHAQIAQMRALESGSYVVRAAATGVSGIIAPDGAWQSRAGLDVQRVVGGSIGPPVGSAFARIGPNAVVIAIAVLYLTLLTLSGVFGKRDA